MWDQCTLCASSMQVEYRIDKDTNTSLIFFRLTIDEMPSFSAEDHLLGDVRIDLSKMAQVRDPSCRIIHHNSASVSQVLISWYHGICQYLQCLQIIIEQKRQRRRRRRHHHHDNNNNNKNKKEQKRTETQKKTKNEKGNNWHDFA